jgi:TolB-like protein/Flp pilus assembly protein TadD
VSGPQPGHAGEGDRQPSPEAVREELGCILASEEFVASERLRAFLRFVVEEALAGRADRLKAYTIALEVFGRDGSFDPQTDPVVRMEAGKLRRRLELYYLGAGRGDPVRIEIPKGSYAPTFAWQRPGAATDQANASGLFRRRFSRHGFLGLGGLALAVLVLLLATIWLRSEAPPQQAAAEHAARQERGPAIIVLPFEGLSEGDADNVFAGGLTEELISNLMRFGELRLYSSYASFQEQANADPVELGKRLDVGYVVKGSVRRSADQVRVIVHLIAARTGQYLWTETYDRALTPENVFGLQEQLAADLASQLAQPYGIVNRVTADAFRQQRPETLFAYDCVLRALAYRRTNDRELYAPSRECLEQAVLRDPRYADAWALLAFAQLDEYRYGYGPGSGAAAVLEQALNSARHAVDLDGGGVLGLLALSSVDFYRRDFAEADDVNRRLLALNPTNPEVLAQVGWRTAFARNWDEGMALVREAIDRSIKAPEWYHLITAFDRYRSGDYRAALADLTTISQSSWVWGSLVLAAAQGQLGNEDEARRALERAMALSPDVLQNPRVAMSVHNIPPSLIDKLMDGLTKAGLRTS